MNFIKWMKKLFVKYIPDICDSATFTNGEPISIDVKPIINETIAEA